MVLFLIDKSIYKNSDFDIIISDSQEVKFFQSDKEIELHNGIYLYSYEQSEVLSIPSFIKINRFIKLSHILMDGCQHC